MDQGSAAGHAGKPAWVIDVDDFHEGNTGFPLLDMIAARLPGFKATLFAVLGRCKPEWLREIRAARPWIDVAAHGFMHETARECEQWDRDHCEWYLDLAEKFEITHGFKAPGWQISDAMYDALQARGWWVADQIYNNARRPAGLRAYLLDAGYKLHYHVQDVCGNGLAESLDGILSLDCKRGFWFVREVV